MIPISPSASSGDNNVHPDDRGEGDDSTGDPTRFQFELTLEEDREGEAAAAEESAAAAAAAAAAVVDVREEEEDERRGGGEQEQVSPSHVRILEPPTISLGEVAGEDEEEDEEAGEEDPAVVV